MIRGATLISMALGALIAVFVFTLKYEVQDLESEYARLNRAIDKERQAIHVLTAEWSHLNEPSRLRALAEAQLGLETIDVGHLSNLAELEPRDPVEELLVEEGVEFQEVVQHLTEPPAPSSVRPPEYRQQSPVSESGFDRIEATLKALSQGGPPE